MRRRSLAVGLAAVMAGACQQAQTAPLYEEVPVTRRDIVVTATALGTLRPILTFSVKSKAWGQILDMRVQSGDEVKKGQLLASIDPRIQRDNLTTARANLARAEAQLANATSQFQRADALFHSQSIAETDYEVAKLAFVTAHAAVATGTANLATANDAMEDTHVRAPITGTILELDAVRGTVISSPTLGGGTVILKMANLDTIQDSALVLETDIGKVQPGLPVTITVDAYPTRPFQGAVLKIIPQAQVVQNATNFPVLMQIPNTDRLLRPGMNTRVQIHTGNRHNVLAIPNAALRTTRDVASAAAVLGLDAAAVQQQLAQAATRAPVAGGDTAAGAGRTRSQTSRTPGAAPRRGGGGGRAGGGGRTNGSSYVVFVRRQGKSVAVPITTGLSDQDYVEILTGLRQEDTVLVLPSASLLQSQQQMRQRFQTVTGGGLPGLRQQSPSAPPASAAPRQP